MTTPALAGDAITRDRARELLGQVMGFVAVTVGFAALGAYLGRDLSGAAGLVLFIGAFACIVGLNVAAAKGREQLAIGLLFGLGLLLGPGGRPPHRRLRQRRPVRSVAGGRSHRGVRRRLRRLRLRHAQRPLLVGAHPVLGAAGPDRVRDRRDLRLDPQQPDHLRRRRTRDLRRVHDLSTSTACAEQAPTAPSLSPSASSSTSSTSSSSRSASSAAGATRSHANTRSKESAMSDNTETADPRGRLLLGRPGAAAPPRRGHLHPGRLHRREERPPELREPSWSRRGGRDRLRPRAHLLPGHPGVLLPDPRPDDQGPPGQRLRL